MPQECSPPSLNATPSEIQQILEQSKVIAMVGLSDKRDRASFQVASYLKSQGYRIIPVNPNTNQILGERAYATLKKIPEKIDIINIFRKPDAVAEIVDGAIEIGAKTVWMQEGIVHNASAEKAKKAGLTVVMNRCIMKEHRALKEQPRH